MAFDERSDSDEEFEEELETGNDDLDDADEDQLGDDDVDLEYEVAPDDEEYEDDDEEDVEADNDEAYEDEDVIEEADEDEEYEDEEYEDEEYEDEEVDNDDLEYEDGGEGVGEEDDEEDDEEEFSLDQLSAAYAEVLKQRKPEAAEATPDSSAAPVAEASTSNDQVVDDRVDQKKQKQIKAEADRLAVREADLDHDLAVCPVSPESILEAVLFVGCPKDIKLNSRKIAALMRDVSPKEVTSLVKKLNAKYEQEGAAYRITSTKGTLKMELHPDLAHVQNRIRGGERAKQLSQQAIDVLAVVAYNQPISREKVDFIRGKSSGSIINQMIRRKLLEVESIDNKRHFRTTERFLDLFSLENLDDLPQTHDVSDIEELAD